MSSFKTHHPSLWYLVYTKPRQEEIARVNLEQQGFESYLPLYKKFKKTETGLVSVFEPMFPRYIFSRPGRVEQSLSTVRNTRGVSNLVRFGFEPALIDEVLLQRIRHMEQTRDQASLQDMSNLRKGQSVRVQHAALAGVEGLVQSVSSKRVAVLLEILGRPAVVSLEHHQVAASGD